MPEAMTPLTMSVVVPAFENGLMNYSPIQIEKPKYANSIFAIAYNRITMNIFNVVLKAVKEEITIQNRLHELSIFGHNVSVMIKERNRFRNLFTLFLLLLFNSL